MMTTCSGIPALDRAFDEAVRSAFRGTRDGATLRVPADIREAGDGYTFELDVPGVKQDDLEITLTERTLSIRGTRSLRRDDAETVTCGRPSGTFAVSYGLPEGIEGEALTASLANGVLTIRVPKQPKAQPRKIPIGTAAKQKSLGE